MRDDSVLLHWLLFLVVVLWMQRRKLRHFIKALRQEWKERLPRRWKPQSPHDCRQCRAGLRLEAMRGKADIEPYSQRKSRRGRKKRVATGVDVSVLVRFPGHADATVARWLERMGRHSQGWHNVMFRNLVLRLVQMDALYTRVRATASAAWLWLVIDPVSKAIPALHVGGRTKDDAFAVVHDLKERLDPRPGVCASGHHGLVAQHLLRADGAFREVVSARESGYGAMANE